MAGRRSNENYLTDAEYYIMLAMDEPKYGYSIMQQTPRISEDIVKLGSATMYTILRRLLERELLESTENAPEDDSRRKPYRMTERGRAVLINEVFRRCAMAEHGVQILTKMGWM